MSASSSHRPIDDVNGPGEQSAAAAPESSPGAATEPSAGVSSAVKLRGASVAPGLVLGTVHRRDKAFTGSWERVPRGGIDDELGRFRSARQKAGDQLRDLKQRVAGRVGDEDARILDTHLTYLDDSAFITDVENLITGDQMRLEAAIAKVVGDFDRIFRLVENQVLRQSAVDLRDVGMRVLRNLEGDATHSSVAPQSAPEDVEGPEDVVQDVKDCVLVARELNIVDMFNLAGDHVRGIATEEGGLTSHAAIFARSMRIPTVTAIPSLLDQVREGDFVLLDATDGVLHLNPDEQVRRQYRGAANAAQAATVPSLAERDVVLRSGEELELSACCGNLPEAEQAAQIGVPRVGLYRTELLYLVDPQPPSEEALREHYAAVLAAAGGARVTFRLLDLGPDVRVPWLPRASTDAFGRAGVRTLLQHEDLARVQLRALLQACTDSELTLAAPFVTDCGELVRLRELLIDERTELRTRGSLGDVEVSLGAVIESPAALLGMRDLARAADFLTVNLDALLENVLHVDRDRTESGDAFRALHPYVLRALTKLSEVCASEGRDLEIFGVSTTENLDLLIGAGLRSFCVPPGEVEDFLDRVAEIDGEEAGERLRLAAAQSWPGQSIPRAADFQHGQR